MVHDTFVFLASLFAGAFCATTYFSAMRAWDCRRGRCRAPLYDKAASGLKRGPQELLVGRGMACPGLADEAEQWLRDRRD